MKEARRIATIVPVSEDAYTRLDRDMLLASTELTARDAMAKAGKVITQLELEIRHPVEIDGLRMPIVLDDGTELPNDLILFRYSAFAIPHGEVD